MKKIFLVIFTLLFLNLASGLAQDKTASYDDFKAKVNKLEKMKKYDEAIKFTQKAWEQFPDRMFELIKELEYLYNKTGQYEKNLNLWRNGHEQGFFFLLNKRMKKFAPYLQFFQFDSLVLKDTALREAAIAKAKTIYRIVKPVNFDPDRKYPLALIFHGGGSNLERVQKHWHSTQLDSFFIKVYLQSYRYYDSRTYGWRSGDKRAYSEIKTIYNRIRKQVEIDTMNILLAGISAGGTFALDLISHKIIPATLFIGFCSGMPQYFNESVAQKLKLNNTKIFIVGGEKDYYLPKQKQLMEIFNKIQMDAKHIIVEKMGHQYPVNEGYYINQAIKYFQVNKKTEKNGSVKS